MKYLSTLNLVPPVTATGGNALRLLSDRFADIINIKDQVAGVGQGNSAVDTAALQATITKARTNPGSTIYIPAGAYIFQVPASSTLFAVPASTKIVGAGRDQVTITWNDDSGCTLFGANSSVGSRISNILFSGMTIVGTGNTRGNTNSYAFNLSYVNGLEFHDIATNYSRNNAIYATYCADVLADDCMILNSYNDGINFQGCSGAIVSNNRIRHIDGDAISVNSDTSDFGTVRRNIAVIGNRVFDAQGIRIMSARHANLAGNQMDAIRSYAFNLSTIAPTGSGLLIGASSGLAISITGNTVTNLLNRQNIDNQTQGCPGIIISGASARAGTYNAIPGEADHIVGDVIDPYRETFANANATNVPTGGIYAITISGNTFARTLPACNNSDSRFTKWSDFGLGTIFTKSGSQNPTLAESDMRDAAIELTGGVIRDVLITGNTFRGLDSGLALMNGVRYDNIVFRGNHVLDCYSNGVIVNTSGILRLYVDDNVFDLDPYLKHANRGGNGTWQTTNGPIALNVIAGSGIYMRRNILRNLTLDFGGDSSTTTAGVYFDRNIVEADASVFGSFSTTNKGVGLVRSNGATIYSRVDSDPASTTFGSVLSMPSTPTNTLVGRMSAGSGTTETIPLGSGLAISNGNLVTSLPTPLFASTIQAAGAVASITFTSSVGYRVFPSISLGAPPPGGAQAVAIVSSMGVFSVGGLGAIGSNYSVNDLLTLVGGTGTAAVLKVSTTNVNGGITGYTVFSIGSYTVLPGTTITTTGGTGTGATVTNILYTPLTAAIVSGGGGYPSAPLVTLSSYAGSTATATSTLTNNFALTGGNGQLQLTNAGTVLGTSGTGGSPVVHNAAVLDQSKVRIAATGSSFTIPVNTSWLALVQTGTISAQTLTFPVASGDGQIMRISTIGAITALTLTPQSGTSIAWSNGSTLAANSAATFGWDAVSTTWMRL